jgi:hypothetical protein
MPGLQETTIKPRSDQMPLHLILIMTGSIAFILWLAFQDAGEAELHELQAETEALPTSEPV